MSRLGLRKNSQKHVIKISRDGRSSRGFGLFRVASLDARMQKLEAEYVQFGAKIVSAHQQLNNFTWTAFVQVDLLLSGMIMNKISTAKRKYHHKDLPFFCSLQPGK